MLSVVVSAASAYDEANNLFYYTKEQTLDLEHSLVSLSKWEAKWKMPFLDKTKPKTHEQMIDYIRCMTLTRGVDPMVYNVIPNSVVEEISQYMEDPMTATTFSKTSESSDGRIVTAEMIYYWMTVQNIPFECEKWHLNRLLALIRVCSVENAPKKKMSMDERRSRYRELNNIRRKKYGTKG